MTKSEILGLLGPLDDDETISICIADDAEHLDEVEPGSLLDIVDCGYVARQHVLYVKPR